VEWVFPREKAKSVFFFFLGGVWVCGRRGLFGGKFGLKLERCVMRFLWVDNKVPHMLVSLGRRRS